ncbi:DnaT-like ssDNA-binding domain-containing protein [Enterobacter roggenkampii]|uniref:DnaT-like ssDNA-binding domain-containing protein n=1 Tax=Enterobacterales TaxID=91347 RepID=UPI002021F6B5|nr:DnaT-like ssDNA-binding domain-containing protein [Enterobacter roggenkampii]MCL8154070.1 DnaT-like ssDNA-binding domain-containing protein [Enterobacter roggenkampii]MCM7558192.1 DnaT-like ssDNA-binding domain-containing protein [Enterobacter roggenkampii]MDH0554305.1 DnaT-like ssDNA-binding domain-containing protein [Enterobacter roggenkampii]
MAGDWIKMRADLHTHPKVVRMASALKADRLRIVGGLHSAWCLFDVHSVDGYLDGYSPETLDDLIGFPGFARAMMAVGWLEEDGESLVMPRFEAHNGQSAKRRAQDADRKRSVRKMSASEADKKRTREEKRREDIKPHINPTHNARAKNPVDNFLMHLDWKPDSDFVEQSKDWGTPVENGVRKTELASFIDFWKCEGIELNQYQWQQKLARHIIRVRNNSE